MSLLNPKIVSEQETRLSDRMNQVMILLIVCLVGFQGIEIANAAGLTAKPIDNGLLGDTFKVLFGIVSGLLDPRIGTASSALKNIISKIKDDKKEETSDGS